MTEQRKEDELQIAKENENEEESHGSFGWFNFEPKCLQFLNSPVSLLFFLCAYFFANSAVVNGIYSTSISTIEKRFNLSSSQMGVITSIYDVAALLVTGPVSYFGARRKSRCLGIGMLTMGFAYLVFILPHFIEAPYQPVISTLKDSANVTSSVLCNGTINKNIPTESSSRHGSSLYYGIFLLAMFIAGAGCTPMLSLGVPFLDESVSERKSPIYIGIMQAWGILAVVVGFILAGVFLGIFVHPGADVKITTKNAESWIGAWWLGFAIFAGLAFVVGIFLLGIPARVKSKDKEVKQKLKNEQQKLTKSELLESLKTLFLRNPTYVCICLAVSIDNFNNSSAVAFAPKMTIFQYKLAPSQAGFYFGVFLGLGAVIGVLAGSYIQKRLKLSTVGTLKMTAIISALTMLTVCNVFLFCENPPIAGIHKSRLGSLGCSNNCHCPSNVYLPVCGKDKMTYISPCHAGCQGFSSAKVFSNCSCSARQDSENHDAMLGFCQSDCGFFPYLYFAVGFVSSVISCFVWVPCTMATMRCTPFRLRSFAMGIQWMMVRVIGSIPGPILVGYIIDQHCVHWFTTGSMSEKSCRIYDNKKLAISIGILTVSLRAMATLFLVLALIFERRKDNKTENSDASYVDTFL